MIARNRPQTDAQSVYPFGCPTQADHPLDAENMVSQNIT